MTPTAAEAKPAAWKVGKATVIMALVVGAGLGACITATSTGMLHAATMGDAPVAVVRKALARLGEPGAETVFEAKPAAMPGFMEASDNGRMVYVSNDGRYVVNGEVRDTRTRQNLSDAAMDALRARVLAGVAPADRVTFAAKDEKAAVTVFTDPDCPYCRAFHQHMGALNAAGVTVHYLPMPLPFHEGADTKTASIWCAQRPQEQLTAALAGAQVPAAECANPIERSLRLARQLGVQGTPGVIAPNGHFVNPALAADPAQFLAELGMDEDQSAAGAKRG